MPAYTIVAVRSDPASAACREGAIFERAGFNGDLTRRATGAGAGKGDTHA